MVRFVFSECACPHCGAEVKAFVREGGDTFSVEGCRHVIVTGGAYPAGFYGDGDNFDPDASITGHRTGVSFLSHVPRIT